MSLRSRRLPPVGLIEMARSLRYSLSGSMMVRDAMELLALNGTPRLRPVAANVARELKAGYSLPDAMAKQDGAFPPLFLALTAVGEESGNVPEVMGELERYYELQQKLGRDFRSEIAWPLFQFVFATLVVAGLIYILGQLPTPRYEQRFDALGLGLFGAAGAATFLAAVYGSLALLAAAFALARRALRRRAVVERMLLRLPLVGPCVRDIAVTRFCVALQLMLETSMSILKTMRLAFAATDNGAFEATAPAAEAELRRGNGVAVAVGATGMFPTTFVSALTIAEESGRLPEMFRQQAAHFDEMARRRLTVINRLMSWGVWLGIAVLMTVAIFRIFTQGYLDNIQKVLPQ